MSDPQRASAWRRVALALVAVGLVAHATRFTFVCDDAFISFRYADNLVRHGSLVYDLGTRVEGYTNFLWTLLMAALLRLGRDPVTWSPVLGIACGVGVLLAMARFEARRHPMSHARDALPAALLAASPAFACWCTGGLETQLFTLLLTLAWTAFLLEGATPRSRPWSALWFALAALTRPEGVLFFALAALYRWIPRALRRHAIDRRGAASWIGVFCALYVPYFVWRWSYYGALLPNTYTAKVGGAFLWRSGMTEAGSWAVTHAALLLAALAAWPLSRRSAHLAAGARTLADASSPADTTTRANTRTLANTTTHPDTHTLADTSARPNTRALAAFAALYTGALGLHVVRAGGDFMALHRFWVPVLPLVACVAAEGLRLAAARLRAAGVSRGALTGLAAGLALLVGLQVAAIDRDALRIHRASGRDSIGLLRTFAAQWTAIGRWLSANAPPDTRIATTAAGAIPYWSRLPTLDMLGLNDAWIARHVPATPGNDVGHTRVAPATYLIEQHVDCVIGHPLVTDREPRPLPADLEFWNAHGYGWRTVRVPGMSPPWWGYWQRVR